MEEKKYVISKKDIILFLLIAIFYMIIDNSIELITHKPEEWFVEVLICHIIFCLPSIIAIIINLIVAKRKNIKERTVKIIKILFCIFTILNFILSALIALALCFFSLWVEGS